MLAPSFQSDPFPQSRQVIVRHFPDLASATIVPLTQPSGFSGAAIYRVEHHGRSYCLRRWPVSSPEPARLRGLHRLLGRLSQAQITQIAVPLKSSSGSTLVWSDNAWWQLEPWLPGRADFHSHPSRVRLRNAMLVLTQWHYAARTFVPNADEAPWFSSQKSASSPGIGERWNAINQWRNVAQINTRKRWPAHPDSEIHELVIQIWGHCESLAPIVADKLSRALTIEVPLLPCLRDVWHDHLLFTGDELTGLIDPSACRVENVATDLARLLGSLLEDNPTEWEFALDCYREFRRLSLTELQLLPLFDQSGVLLSGITWLDWLLDQRRQFPSREQVIARLQAVLRRLTHLRMRV